jgi:hypothetical protein
MIRHLYKTITIILFLVSTSIFAHESNDNKIDNAKALAGCSKCVFHSSDKCSLAVKIDDEVYEVEGSSLKDHGRPRAKDGLCKVEREAEISGEIKDGKFLAFNFKLLPMQLDKLQLIEIEDS